MKFSIVLCLLFAVSICAACNSSSAETQTSVIKQISVEQAKKETEKENIQFIDVRTEAEYLSGHAPGTINLPLDSLEQNLSKLDKSKPVYVICQTGRRSQKGAEMLEKKGFKDLYNIEGGTSAWEKAGLPIEK
ncbi:MAG: rhodanese-like domain-containing protein [Acidobacteriota bacterium]|nr:rhodanese-like domain-containing protein [Acidobacteriota bacterium]